MSVTETTTTIGSDEPSLSFIDIKLLKPRPENLREVVDGSDLVASIKEAGILQPLNVTLDPEDGKFWINAGHRRLDGAKRAKLKQVPCLVSTITEAAAIDALMLVENLQREDLDVVEEATGFARLAGFGWTQKQIAERTGFHPSVISRRIKISRLPAALLAELRNDELPLEQAEKLVDLVDVVGEEQTLEWIEKQGRYLYSHSIEHAVAQAKLNIAMEKLGAKLQKSGVPFVPAAQVQARHTTSLDPALFVLDAGETFTWVLVTRDEPIGTPDDEDYDPEDTREVLWTVGTGPLDIEAALAVPEIDALTVQLVQTPDGRSAQIVGVHREVVAEVVDGDDAPDPKKLAAAEEKQKRAAERAKQAHHREQLQAMASAKFSKSDLSDWIVRCWMADVHEEKKSHAARILGLEPVEETQTQWDKSTKVVKNYRQAFMNEVAAASGMALARLQLALVIADTDGSWGDKTDLFNELKVTLGYEEFAGS